MTCNKMVELLARCLPEDEKKGIESICTSEN